MTVTGLCGPWMPLKIKLMEKSQAQQRGTWTHMVTEMIGCLDGVNLPACRGLSGGQGEVREWGT